MLDFVWVFIYLGLYFACELCWVVWTSAGGVFVIWLFICVFLNCCYTPCFAVGLRLLVVVVVCLGLCV